MRPACCSARRPNPYSRPGRSWPSFGNSATRHGNTSKHGSHWQGRATIRGTSCSPSSPRRASSCPSTTSLPRSWKRRRASAARPGSPRCSHMRFPSSPACCRSKTPNGRSPSSTRRSRSVRPSATGWASLLVLETQANIAARRGEWPTALRTALEAAELKLQLGDLASIVESVYLAGVALAALERPRTRGGAPRHADALPPDGRDYPDSTIEMVSRRPSSLAPRSARGATARRAQGTGGGVRDRRCNLAYLRAEAELPCSRDG